MRQGVNTEVLFCVFVFLCFFDFGEFAFFMFLLRFFALGTSRVHVAFSPSGN